MKRKPTFVNIGEEFKNSGMPEKDKEKENFEKIIIDNSACNLKYGKGKHIEYDIERIKSETVELLLHGKYLIDLE